MPTTCFARDTRILTRVLDPEEQEKRMKFKELLANSLILQNASDMTDVLRTLAAEGYEIRREHLAHTGAVAGAPRVVAAPKEATLAAPAARAGYPPRSP